MQFKYIEDYILFIAGLKTNTGANTGNFWASPVLRLANYDVGFITSLSEQIGRGIGMTDRQAALTYKLIDKYKQQLQSRGVDLPNHTNHQFPIRAVERDSKAYINSERMLCLKFPYNEDRINVIKDFSKTSQGNVSWNPSVKEWQFSLTEFNVSWVHAFAAAHHFKISTDLIDLFDLILEVEKTDYKIELQYADGKYSVTNASDSLNEYLASTCGFDDKYALVDYSGVLGYTVNDGILNEVREKYGDVFVSMTTGRHIDHPAGENLDAVVAWAKTVHRLPICVYNPNFTALSATEFYKYFDPSEVVEIGLRTDVSTFTLDPAIKLVYTTKVITEWPGNIPLLISYANLHHGSSKRHFFNKAEKVVFHCATLPRT